MRSGVTAVQECGVSVHVDRSRLQPRAMVEAGSVEGWFYLGLLPWVRSCCRRASDPTSVGSAAVRTPRCPRSLTFGGRLYDVLV